MTAGLGKQCIVRLILACLALSACEQKMANQPKYQPYQASTFFEDGRASRPLVPGTVARGQARIDTHLYTATVNGKLADTFPFPVTKAVLARGQERYNIFCVPCHDAVGTGRGMIVRRGFQPPPSFHIKRLREAPVGYFFTVISNGFGSMYDYAARVHPRDRWAIIAYIRALQLSQHAVLADLPAVDRQHLPEPHQ